MTDAPLTPAEAYVLLDPDGASSTEAFKITLLLLVAMDVLEIAEVDRRVLFMRRGTKSVVSVVRDPPALFLAAEVVDVVRNARASERGCDFLSLAHSAYKRVLRGASDLVSGRIRPALAARGWLELFEAGPPTRYRPTPAGLAEKQRLQLRLDRARRVPALIDANPAEAEAILQATGPLLLLVPELRSHYGKLAALDARLLAQGFVDFEDYFDGSRYT